MFLLFFLFLLKSSYGYQDAYKNYSVTTGQEHAVLVIGYNRPNYLSECIKSLERSQETNTICFIFALDGGPEATQEENSELIKQALFKNKIIMLRKHNYGCPKNHIDAQRFAFDWCKFKKVIILQEDMRVTSGFVPFMFNFHNWAAKNYTNIGAVEASSFSFLSAEDKKNNNNLVAEDDAWWLFRSYCIDSFAWDTIKPILYTYESLLDKIPLTDTYSQIRSKPELWEESYRIKEWTDSLLQENKSIAPSSISHFISNNYASWYFRFGLFNEDNIMALAFYLHNLVKLRPLAARALHSGEFGISSDVSKRECDRLRGKVNLDEMPGDHMIENFNLVKDEHYQIFLSLLGE